MYVLLAKMDGPQIITEFVNRIAYSLIQIALYVILINQLKMTDAWNAKILFGQSDMTIIQDYIYVGLLAIN